MIDGHGYLLDAAGRRLQNIRPGGDRWAYSYNDRGEVIGSARTDSSGAPLRGSQWGYAYDGIGNRIASTERSVADDSVIPTTYDSGSTNTYTSRTYIYSASMQAVRGTAHPDAVVTVKTYAGSQAPDQTLTAIRENAEFSAEPGVETSATGTADDQAWRNLRIEASRAGVGKDGQTVITQIPGQPGLYFPPGEELFQHDEDGNLTRDARWHYQWDAENRLTRMETTSEALASGVPAQRLTFVYDAQGRRVRKLVEAHQSGGTWGVTSDARFIYDEWNLVAEFIVNAQSASLALQRSYTWGRPQRQPARCRWRGWPSAGEELQSFGPAVHGRTDL